MADVDLSKATAESAKTAVHVVIGVQKELVGGGNDVLNTTIDLARELKDLGIKGMEVTGDKLEALLDRLIDRAAGLI